MSYYYRVTGGIIPILIYGREEFRFQIGIAVQELIDLIIS